MPTWTDTDDARSLEELYSMGRVLTLVLTMATAASTGTLALPQATTEHLATLATVSHPPGASPELKTLSDLLPKIFEHAIAITENSWELGALTQALLEVYDPKLAPFEYDAKAVNGEMNIPWQVIDITNKTLAIYNWTGSPGDVYGWYDSNGNDTDTDTDANSNAKRAGRWLGEYLDPATARVPLNASRVLVKGDGALGDPCSLGPAVFLLA